MEKVRDKITFHVISHTHWDREWYLPFEVFRIELVELIDNLLDILEQNKEFIFHLDGQSIILQDYLEIKPYKREQIKKFVKSGNLLIGPWYVLSDQFLTSGEATIRNLLYGIRDSKELGDVMLVGYCPDQFGQIAQLPQIFKGFNINSTIVGRGIQDSMAEHVWYGLNGDSVLTIALTHWYNNAQRFPDSVKELHEYVDKIYDTQSKTSLSGHVLLMNGCDHLFPQDNLNEILKSINSNGKWEIKHDNLQKAVETLRRNVSTIAENYPIYFGELRDDNNKYILAGTLSSRVYLKLENYKCQTNLEKIVEPLSVVVETLRRSVSIKCVSPGNISTYPYDQIKYAWKLLMQNHAHDSICGCSVDDVHKEMEIRFLKVKQICNKLQENLLSCLGRDTPMERLYVQLINLSGCHRNDIIEIDLEFPLGPPSEHPSASPTVNKEEIKNIILKNGNKNIDFKILESTKTFKMVRSNDEVPLLQAIQRMKILLQVDLEPFSICSYEIEEKRNGEIAKWRNSKGLEFQNKDYKLKINQDSTISIYFNNLTDKFENIHYLTIEDDLGDEYNFVSAKDFKIIDLRSCKWDIKVIEENDFRKRFSLITNHIPELDLQIEMTCYNNTNRIDFKTQVTNRLKNKRIRLHFPTNLNTGYLSADTPCGVIQRSRPPLDWTNYATGQPLYNWIDQSNKKIGLAFFGNGLADYELYENSNGFAVTLIRAVGRLSAVKSHSLIETPDAQCNRDIEFSYAIYPHEGDWESSKLQKEQIIYQTPIMTNQSNLDLSIPALIRVSEDLIISSTKRSEDNENIYILRLFNPFNKALDACRLDLNFSFKGLYLLNLNEEKLNILSNRNGQVNFNIKPHEILTFGIEI